MRKLKQRNVMAGNKSEALLNFIFIDYFYVKTSDNKLFEVFSFAWWNLKKIMTIFLLFDD